MNIDHETVERVSSGATFGGGIGAFLGGMTANEIAAFGGLAIAFVGLIVNTVVSIYYREKNYRLRLRQIRRAQEDEDDGA